ncbi:MAG: GFA family protein [Pseudomonadales bacterium]
MTQVRAGQCRCGELQFEVDRPPILTAACHCRGCQRMTSSAYSLTEIYPRDAFKVTLGEPVLGGLQQGTRHYFCPRCKSWLFTHPEGEEALVNVRATMMEDAQAFVPFIEFFTSEALPWARTGAAHSFETTPPNEQWPDLIAEYQNKG